MHHTEHHLEGNLDAPARSRRLVEEWIRDDPRRHEIVLAVSEIVANAVVHGGPRSVEQGITMAIDSDDARLRVAVSHTGPGFQPQLDRALSGLKIVDGTVDRWGIEEQGEKVSVWFEMDRASDEASPSGEGVRFPDPGRTNMGSDT